MPKNYQESHVAVEIKSIKQARDLEADSIFNNKANFYASFNGQFYGDSQPISLTQCLINQIKEAVFCLDSDGNFQYINDAACALIGYRREDLSQITIDEIEIDFFSQDWSEYWRLIQQQSSVNFQTELSTNGDNKVLDITINFLQHNSQGYACIFVRKLSKSLSQTPLKVFPSQKKISQDQTSFYPNCTQLKPIFEFIENNYTQPITLNDVAEAVGYSPAYLTNLVKRRTQKTIMNWILERRMIQARSLLLNSKDSITKIAISIGFSDPYYFSRRFSQLHEISPKHWREQHQSTLQVSLHSQRNYVSPSTNLIPLSQQNFKIKSA